MATTIGMPSIQIEFKSKGLTAIGRSERGRVVLLLKDSTQKTTPIVHRSLADVDETKNYTAKSIDYIRLAFRGNPNRVTTYVVTDETLGEVLKKLQNIQFDYLAMPEASEEQNETIASWIKMQRKNDKIYKFVAWNHEADHEGVINFASDKIATKNKEYKGQEFTARIAGILAGMSLQQSATFHELKEVESVEQIENLDDVIKQGKLVLFNDVETIRLARAVNSLTTLNAEKGEDFCKIKIVEAMDLVKNDIRSTFYNHYVGKVQNSYDNKQLFLANINRVYFPEIAGDILESSFDNRVELDLEAQKKYAITKGEDVDAMTEMEIKQYPTGSKVMITGKIKFLDAMEDLSITFNI
ncbi:MAG: phage tail sheath C-terminal domain-containing protein [Peptostreptococcaceae bacterium]|nr:phage tail sheath C-terminal domain-containing protein [Peptostreptococcaceae bacterium]